MVEDSYQSQSQKSGEQPEQTKTPAPEKVDFNAVPAPGPSSAELILQEIQAEQQVKLEEPKPGEQPEEKKEELEKEVAIEFTLDECEGLLTAVYAIIPLACQAPPDFTFPQELIQQRSKQLMAIMKRYGFMLPKYIDIICFMGCMATDIVLCIKVAKQNKKDKTRDE